MILDGLSGTNTSGTEGSQSAQSQQKLQEDLNKFLNLLVTQLKNQDPLDPLDANEFTSQLVQFASVEQQIYQNSNLEKMLDIQESSQVSVMINYLDKVIEADGKKLPVEAGTDSEFTYELEKNASEVFVTIKNAKGETVYTRDGDSGVGKHSLTWDGKDLNNSPVPPGTYEVWVTAFAADRSIIDSKQTVFGRVTGASSADGTPKLFMGDIGVELDGILSVREADKVLN